MRWDAMQHDAADDAATLVTRLYAMRHDATQWDATRHDATDDAATLVTQHDAMRHEATQHEATGMRCSLMRQTTLLRL